jgi:hypothetical protein
VERELFDLAGNNWSHWRSNKRFKEEFGSHTREILIRFTSEVGYAWDFTFDTESIAVRNLKLER